MNACNCHSSFYLTGKPEYLGLMYEFKSDSKLKTFMTTRTGLGKSTYPLIEILEVIKNTVAREEMYLRDNPSVVICKYPLDIVLGVKSFHVTEVLMIVSNHIIKLKNQPSYLVHKGNRCSRTLETLKIKNLTISDSTSRHRVKPNFLKILNSIEKDLTNQSTFTVNLLLDLLVHYLLKNKHTIFIDPTNQNMFHIRKDPLSTILGVNAFHKCQILFLINEQLLIDASSQTSEEFTTLCANRKSSQCYDSDGSLVNSDNSDNETMGIIKVRETKCSRCQSEVANGMNCCQVCWKENKKIRSLRKRKFNLVEREVKNLRDDETSQCYLCQDRKIDTIFMHGSTGHKSACYKCAKQTWRNGNCPICKKQIDNIIRVIPNPSSASPSQGSVQH